MVCLKSAWARPKPPRCLRHLDIPNIWLIVKCRLKVAGETHFRQVLRLPAQPDFKIARINTKVIVALGFYARVARLTLPHTVSENFSLLLI